MCKYFYSAALSGGSITTSAIEVFGVVVFGFKFQLLMAQCCWFIGRKGLVHDIYIYTAARCAHESQIWSKWLCSWTYLHDFNCGN